MPTVCSLARITQRASGCAAQSVSTHLYSSEGGSAVRASERADGCGAARGAGRREGGKGVVRCRTRASHSRFADISTDLPHPTDLVRVWIRG